MSFFKKWFKTEKKSNPSMALVNMGSAISPPKDYESFSKEGYQNCVVAYRCIRLIAINSAKVPLILYKKLKDGSVEEVSSHPILDLLNKPNPIMDWNLFIENALGFLNISGNSFIKAVKPSEGKPPAEIWSLRPDRMKIVPGTGGLPSAYQYKVNNDTEVFPVDLLGRSNIVHMKLFNPLDDWYGLSPLESAAINVDIFTETNKSNLSLLKNQARPSGVIKLLQDDRNTGILTDERRNKLRAKLEEKWQGPINSGRPVILEGGMEWQQVGLSPRDMDFFNSQKVSKTDIALVYGIPPQIVGVEGSLTFANYEQALLTLYDEVIIPQVNFILGYLNRWLVPMFKDDSLYLGYDEDKIGALEPRRTARRTSLVAVNWLTPNEKRFSEGWGTYVEGEEPGDQILISSGQMTLGSITETFDDSHEDEDEDDSNPDTSTIDYEDENEEDENDKSKNNPIINQSTASGFEFVELKAFGKTTRSARRQYLKVLGQKLDAHEKRLFPKLSKHWAREGRLIAEVIKNTNQDVWKYGISKVLTEQEPLLEKILFKSMSEIVADFGSSTLRGFKSYRPDYETKDAWSRLTSAMELYVKNRASSMAKSANNTTKKILEKEIRKTLEQDMVEAIQEGGVIIATTEPKVVKTSNKVYKGFKNARAKTMAMTEAHSAGMEASLNAAEALQLPKMEKEWVSSQDDRTRQEDSRLKNWADHVVMDGTVIGPEEMFQVPSSHGTDLLRFPGDISGPLRQICNCRCGLMYPLIEE